MKFTAVLALLLLTTTYSLGNDRAIRAMAQGQKGYTEKEIREEISKGCDGTGDMALCTWYGYYTKDVALNDTYRLLMRRLVSTDLKNALRKSQKAWLEFRDSDCMFSTGDWEGGSFRRVAIAMCWQEMTDRREKELAEILKCKEGTCFELQDTKSAEPDPQPALDKAIRDGIIRKATAEDVRKFRDAYIDKNYTRKNLLVPVTEDALSVAETDLSRAYVVLDKFTYPSGLVNEYRATFFVPIGVPEPSGDIGHSAFYDFGTLTVVCTAARAAARTGFVSC